jgi:hypothetical protein
MDIIDINEVRQQMAEKIKQGNLEDFTASQHKLVEKLCKQIENLKEKNKHLEEIMKSLTKNNVVMDISAEELICIEQIEILKNRSSQRELSTDEVKRLDLLIKNLKLLRQESTVIMSSKSYRTLPDEDLLAIAQSEE